MVIKKILNKIKYLIKDGFLHIMLGSTLNKAIAFVSSIVIVRIVSKSNYGLLTYVDNLYSYVGLFTGLGMSTAIMKCCTTDTDKGSDRKYLAFSLKYGCLVQLFLSLILVVYTLLMGTAFEGANNLIYLKIMYPCAAFAVTLLQNYLRSQGENKKYSYVSVLQTLTILVCSIILAFPLNVYGVVIARYIGLALAMFLIIVFTRVILKNSEKQKFERTEISEYLKLSVSIMVADIFTSIIPLNEIYVVSEVFKDEAVTATFKVATMFPSQLLFVAGSIIIYLFPKIAKKQNFGEAFDYVKKSALLCFGLIAAITVVGLLANRLLILVIYGEPYLDALSLSNVYWLVYMINAGIRIVPVQVMAALGKAKLNAYVSVATAIVHAVVFYFAISNISLMAGALLTGVVYFVSSALLWCILIYYKKHSAEVKNENNKDNC